MALKDKKAFMSRLLKVVRKTFKDILDGADAAVTTYPARDVLLCALAMFVYKHPSMLAFDLQRRDVKGRLRRNLRWLFRVARALCDTTMRAWLDTVDPAALHSVFQQLFAELRENSCWDGFRLDDRTFAVALGG